MAWAEPDAIPALAIPAMVVAPLVCAYARPPWETTPTPPPRGGVGSTDEEHRREDAGARRDHVSGVAAVVRGPGFTLLGSRRACLRSLGGCAATM